MMKRDGLKPDQPYTFEELSGLDELGATMKQTSKADARPMAHTPGPWFLINDHCVGGPIEPGWEEAGSGIAHCGMRARTQEEARANAALISAAPNLFDACASVWSHLAGTDDPELRKLADECRAAIAKATEKPEG
jgi:hypothetical protein